jgi:hypothetical protein
MTAATATFVTPMPNQQPGQVRGPALNAMYSKADRLIEPAFGRNRSGCSYRAGNLIAAELRGKHGDADRW